MLLFNRTRIPSHTKYLSVSRDILRRRIGVDCKFQQGNSNSIMSIDTLDHIISVGELNQILNAHVKDCVVKDVRLYNQAFTPRWVNHHECYERLEFLGDSVLNLAMSSYLYARYPLESEGFMTRMRSTLVSGEVLYGLAKRHTPFGKFTYRIAANSILKKPGRKGNELPEETLQMACNSKKVLEDVFEAFLGALFLDLGHDVASAWLIDFFERYVDFANVVVSKNNYKDALNCFFMKQHGQKPIFELADLRNTLTTVTVHIRDQNGVIISKGVGANRKAAELDAAMQALRQTHSWDIEGVRPNTLI